MAARASKQAPAAHTSRPATLGALRASGYTPRSVRDEIRANLLSALREGRQVFHGLVGYDDTVVPQVVNALLSRHNILLLGLRGQAKTRLLRQLAGLLDDAIPAIAGSEVNDDPLAPVSGWGKARVAELDDDTPIVWLAREDRYREKLATPDVSIADLIGDLDPIKAAANKLSLSHEESLHYGIIPRTNRGIFAINELPDLQTRIQVGLFNILEEKDVQIRGFPVRLPMDILLCFTANPEDYTNRGSIITPLKDRIESQILTHYPASVDDAVRITEQEAWQQRGESSVEVAPILRSIIDRISFEARDSEFVDQASGVSARLAISALENVISNAERRAALSGDKSARTRLLDLAAAIPAITGKIELVYEGEQEGAFRVATQLVGKAVRWGFEQVFPSAYERKASKRPSPKIANESSAYTEVISHFSVGRKLELTDTQPDKAWSEALEGVAGLKQVVKQHDKPELTGSVALAMELVLEGLHQSSLLAKEDLDRGILYCDMLGAMYAGTDD